MPRPQFTLNFADKERLLVPLIAEAFQRNAQLVPGFDSHLRATGFDPSTAKRLLDFPALPVTMFKEFRLTSCSEAEVARELNSSSTSGQSPSRIFLDKATLRRQARSLVSILKAYLGARRRPYLVLDVPAANDPKAAMLTARGAAIRGLENFASETVYALRQEGQSFELDLPAVQAFADKYSGEECLLFGFTYLIWSVVVQALEQADQQLDLANATVLHGGGWKKLIAQQVSKSEFNRRVAGCLGSREDRVLDYYGMVEQVGCIFVDCEAGNKHSPNFAEILVVNPLTYELVPVGQEGLIVVVSALPSSYPGHVLMTEDQGRLMAIDDCPCGRKGMAIQFTSRVEHVEVRGCGDILAQKSQ